MKAFLKMVAIGLALGLSAGPAPAQADPFTTARYDITIKHNAEALAIVDSKQFDINMQTEEGYTLLHSAADAGNLEMVNALLSRGADPTLKTAAGLRPYDVATGPMVKAVLAKAMNAPNMVSARPAEATPGKGSNGACAAVIAERANNGRSAAMRPILRARDDIWYNHPDELALLLDDCVDANAKDDVGATLLHTAASRDRVSAAKMLIAHGASRVARDRDGKRPADYATSAEMKALLGPASPAAPAAKTASGAAGDKKECAQKYQADVALCSDGTCRMRAMSHWQKCLKTGSYF
jgi:ankyrin repeat protein